MKLGRIFYRLRDDSKEGGPTGRTFQAIGALPPGRAQKGMVFRRGDLSLG